MLEMRLDTKKGFLEAARPRDPIARYSPARLNVRDAMSSAFP
nr:hypothetical protein [Candidatus Sigynarchaeum springense]